MAIYFSEYSLLNDYDHFGRGDAGDVKWFRCHGGRVGTQIVFK